MNKLSWAGMDMCDAFFLPYMEPKIKKKTELEQEMLKKKKTILKEFLWLIS